MVNKYEIPKLQLFDLISDYAYCSGGNGASSSGCTVGGVLSDPGICAPGTTAEPGCIDGSVALGGCALGSGGGVLTRCAAGTGPS